MKLHAFHDNTANTQIEHTCDLEDQDLAAVYSPENFLEILDGDCTACCKIAGHREHNDPGLIERTGFAEKFPDVQRRKLFVAKRK